MRCDLHVHSWYSGRAEVPVLEHVGSECYSDPLDVYEHALARGVDLVTLADHDTIDGALRLVVEGPRRVVPSPGALGAAA
jgi:predicted metal-dependent phosphoesterase TrpH